MAQASLNKTFNNVLNTKSVANSTGSSVTLEETDSGKLILVDASTASTNFTINLPAASAGLNFSLVLVADSHAASEVLIVPNGSEKIDGLSLNSASGPVFHDNVASLGFADAAKIGCQAELVSDGTGWRVVRAHANAALIVAFS